MCKFINFYFNGQEYITNQSITLNDLLYYFNYNTSLFVVEYNNFICNKLEWNKSIIKKNDRIEIITIVGGG